MRGSVRSMSDDAQRVLCERMKTVALGIAKAYGVESEFSLSGTAPTLYNHPDLSKNAASHLRAFFGEERVLFSSDFSGSVGQKRSGGSEDFAHFSHRVPSLLIAVCAGDSREGYLRPLHHPSVLFDERALEYGAKVYELLALCEIGY